MNTNPCHASQLIAELETVPDDEFVIYAAHIADLAQVRADRRALRKVHA